MRRYLAVLAVIAAALFGAVAHPVTRAHADLCTACADPDVPEAAFHLAR